MNKKDELNQENQESSLDEDLINYTDIIKDSAFLGEYPYVSIMEAITGQFNDYVKLEDPENYVDIFYQQLHDSYYAVNTDDEEDHPTEKIEALNDLYEKFVIEMRDLFKARLEITILDCEDYNFTSVDKNDIEYEIRTLYNYFILNAKENFKNAISKDIIEHVDISERDDREFYKSIDNQMYRYTPLFRTINPPQFLDMTGGNEVLELYEASKVVGNFLKKYSPKLYANEEFKMELVSYIVMATTITDNNPV
jgi:hypothetical protein